MPADAAAAEAIAPDTAATMVHADPDRARAGEEAPLDAEALEQFTRQGTLWEAPADGSRARPGPSGAEARGDVAMQAPPLGAWADEPAADTLRRPPPAAHEPDPDPPLRQRSASSALGLSLRDGPPTLETTGDDEPPPAGSRVDAPATSRPADPEPAAGSPPLVVLALVLALGLAVGGAGGYLVGQRSGERAAQRALGDGAELVGENPPPFETAPAPAPATPTPVPDTGGPTTATRAPAERDPSERARERAALTSGQILVRSTPPKAGVIVNGSWRGRTPLTLRSLALGTYTVRVVADGYAAETRRVSIDARVPEATVAVQLARGPAAARPAPVAPRPAATAGSLYLESRPSGARVFLDGTAVGATPLLLSDLAPGAHAIRLEYPGRRPWATSVTIAAGQRQRVAASLEEGS
jgi:hypothetical protein